MQERPDGGGLLAPRGIAMLTASLLLLGISCERSPKAATEPAQAVVEPLQPSAPFDCEAQAWEAARKDARRFIAHAGGAVGGKRYTNSMEALNGAYERGYRLFEIDLIETADGHLVGAHDWGLWQRRTGAAEPSAPTLETFRESKNLDGLTPVTLSDLDAWFAERPGTFLVTDKTRSFRKLLAGFRHHERLIVEVFSLPDYRRAKREGVRFPMLSMPAATGFDRERLLRFVDKERVQLLAFPARETRAQETLLRALRDKDGRARCMFAFSSNETEFIRGGLGDLFFGVYSDHWNVRTGAADPEGKTY
jgi:hypothetical protein